MSQSDREPKPRERRITIVKPTAELGENDRLWQEIQKYKDLIPSAPNPNLGRVEELKEEISKGNYVTPEVLEETAARLALRFMRKE